MTPRSLFLILVKMVGVYLLVKSVPMLSFLVGIIMTDSVQLILVAGYVLLAALLLYYCIFRADVIVDKLRLERGFKEEKFDMNVSSTAVLRVAVIVVGAVTFIFALPSFFTQIANGIQNLQFRNDVMAMMWIFAHATQCLIGFLMVMYNKQIINFIERKSRD